MSGNGQPAVVITGIGAVSPFGVGRDCYWHHVSHGISGCKAITQFDASGYPCRVAASVPPVSIVQALPLEGENGEGVRIRSGIRARRCSASLPREKPGATRASGHENHTPEC